GGTGAAAGGAEVARMQTGADRPAGFRIGAWAPALLLAAVFAAYWPSLRGGLVWDDDAHVTRPELTSLAGLGQIWTRPGATQQYYPVVHSVFWLEHRLWGDATLGYHLVDVLLHAAAACLLAVVLRQLAVPGAWLAAFLFALHPVAVESAAWISEQKNTLSTVCYLLAALAYLRFDSRRTAGAYALGLLFFVLALFSKSVTATLPAALLLVLWWKRGRLDGRRDVLPLLPWLAAGIAAGGFTAWVERHWVGAEGSEYILSFLQRCALSGRIVWFYLGELAWPARLTFIYPHWKIDPGRLLTWLPLAGALAVTALCVRRRGLLAAWLFFAGSLVPALGFFDIYPFRYAYVADHFQYLPSLGIFALAGAGLAWAGGRLPRAAATAGAGALCALLAVLSFRQSRMYRNAETLYRETIARNPACWLAYSNLGTLYLEQGRAAEAERCLDQSLAIKPDADAHYNLANILLAEGRLDDAVPHYREALRLKPDYPEACDNLGTALARLGNLDAAAAEYREALRLQPDYPRARSNLQVILRALGRDPASRPSE
ncbi:MAG TPA: tetratricopeptide repeat protein, partial [Opitutaceae bacterium]|nr:tetratricopeptide repeat protein [Opitutaceae bacterium]